MQKRARIRDMGGTAKHRTAALRASGRFSPSPRQASERCGSSHVLPSGNRGTDPRVPGGLYLLGSRSPRGRACRCTALERAPSTVHCRSVRRGLTAVRASHPWVIGRCFTPKEFLHDGGDGEWGFASGKFDNSEGVLAIRWNGKRGNSFGIHTDVRKPVWFVVLDQLAPGVADLAIKQRVRRSAPDV